MKIFNRILLVVSLALFFVPSRSHANTIRMESIEEDISLSDLSGLSEADVALRPKNKTVAVTLAVTLGVFGVHRLYLGTSNKVPIVYTLTLGGGFGALVVSDIVAILATKEIENFAPSENVFMWAK